ncbi:hypothetical protein [Limnospira platensis]|uniref:Transposase n=1 Tax=Limnospira platensis NIES-46 TaxID=1236695 RepID=A0A5M3T8T8_LIMPL|nr:hypothetical protein [Arthrospira platensis NCB002]QQW30438.1 hypothetical protein AP9108_06940 [Arthrospira sp. PCC 9108]BDT11697.1 hypothetical protein N39L_14200 [Arthrospira platensis NIES-39]GCE94360.1 hypothetical protein NIES46_24150 [Arthrospira platensis NIES-46]
MFSARQGTAVYEIIPLLRFQPVTLDLSRDVSDTDTAIITQLVGICKYN